MRFPVIKLLLFSLCCSPMFAQFELGSIVGLVTDQQNAPVAGAKVEIRSLDTNVKREVTTSASGEYNSLPVQPGRYSVVVHQEGFRDSSSQVTVGVSQRVQADFSIELGAVTEQVNVSATTVGVETASSEIGQVRAAKEIVDLPLNTRNFTQLVQLAPGVTTGVGGASGNLGYTSGRGTNGAVINGAPV